MVVAEHQKTLQLVALKFIDRAKLSRDTNDRVEREIQYLKLLRHPHIIKLYYHCRNVNVDMMSFRLRSSSSW
jgi:serine/threonine protein kinase